MATFKFVISSKDGKAYQVEKEQNTCTALMGKTIGNDFSGDLIGLNGYTLVITGGSDKDGFAMRNDIEGVVRKRFLLIKGVGFKGTKRRDKKIVKLDGLKRKKTLRGNTLADDIVQINCIVSKEGSEKLEKLLGGKKKKKEGDKDASKEETKETPKEEPKKEAPKETPKEEKKEGEE